MTAYTPYEWFEMSPDQQRKFLNDAADLQRRLDKHHAQRDYAARTTSTLATTPNPLPVAHPLERVVASTLFPQENHP